MTFNAKTHNGFITVLNTKTGNHRVFRIRTRKFGDEEKRVLSACEGNREVDDDWCDFAFVSERGVSVWKKYRGGEYARLAAIVADVERGESLGLEYMVEGRCRVCNRPLTDPTSIETGIGPTCSKNNQS